MPSHHKRVSSTALTSCPSWELIQHYPFNITLTSLTHLGAGASLTNCPYPALSDILTGTRLLVTKRAGILFHELFCDCTALSNILIGTRLLVTKRVGIAFHESFWRHMVTAQHLATFWLAQGYWSPRELELCLMSLFDNTWCHPQQAQSVPPPPWRTPIPFLPCVKPAAADHLIYYLH